MRRSAVFCMLLSAACGGSGESDQPAEWLRVGGPVRFPAGETPASPGTIIAAIYGASVEGPFDRCLPYAAQVGAPYRPESNPGFGLRTGALREFTGWRVVVAWTPRPFEELPPYGQPFKLPVVPGDRYWESEYLPGGPCDPMPDDGRPCFMGDFALSAVLTSTITEPCL